MSMTETREGTRSGTADGHQVLHRGDLHAREPARAAQLHDDRGARHLTLAREQLAPRQHEMDARRLDRVERGDGAPKLAFERAHLIDVLDETRRAEGVALVEDLVADGAAVRQSVVGDEHPDPRHLIDRNHDRRAVALELIGHGHGVEFLDDLAAVLGVEVAEQEAVARRRDARADESEEADAGGGDRREHGKPHDAQIAKGLNQAVHR